MSSISGPLCWKTDNMVVWTCGGTVRCCIRTGLTSSGLRLSIWTHMELLRRLLMVQCRLWPMEVRLMFHSAEAREFTDCLVCVRAFVCNVY